MADSRKIIRAWANNDRISQLPDEVLCHILSFLPTEDAVSTCILSPRWNGVWGHISKLRFHDNSSTNGNFVNGAVLSHNPLNLEKFSLSFPDISKLDDVLNDAIIKGIQFLDLCVKDGPTISLPNILFNSKTLEVLRLEGKSIVIKVPDSACLPNLRKMELLKVQYQDDESARSLISSCVSLESLVVEIKMFGNSHTFNISSSTLRKIFIKISEGMDNNRLPGSIIGIFGMNVPALEYIHIRDPSGSVDYRSERLLSLEEAFIDINLCEDDPGGFNSCFVGRIYYALQHVKILTINEDTFKVLTAEPMFNMLTVLKVTTNCCGWGMLKKFLVKSPKLEDLTFTVDPKSVHHHKLRWKNPEWVPTCLMSSLKSISILSSTLFKVELAMAKYVLKNARNLRSMKIRDLHHHGSKKEKMFLNQLKKVRRGSQGCIVSNC